MSKFKVGDRVRVINNPNKNTRYYMDDRSDWQAFVFDMPSMAGKVVTISSVARHGYSIREHEWNWTDEMFVGLAIEPREFIVIHRKGSEVIASYKRGDEIVKTAKAKCAPSDEFNFETGAKLAFDRLVGREEPSACKYGKLSPSGRCMIGEGMVGFSPSYQCIREKCKAHRDHKEPAAPAPKFRAGDQVVSSEYEAGEISAVNAESENIVYLVFFDGMRGHSGHFPIGVASKEAHKGHCIWQSESKLSPAPATQPASRFKVGDRVVCDFYGTGTIEKIYFSLASNVAYGVRLESGCVATAPESKLSPAPEPKYYNGKVFAVRTKDDDATPRMQNRVGHVFEIKDGRIVGERWNFDLGNMRPFNSFSDFCKYCSATEWAEVKE